MPTDDRIGQILGGSYRIEKVLGEGGMGTVYEASHLRVPRHFAIKILNHEVVENREVFDRFRREAEIANAIGNKHIVQVLDFNHTPDGAPYMVLELLEGEDLAHRIARRGKLSVNETASLVEQITGALEAAHANGIVHRDLKPGNIYLIDDDEGRDDFVKVLDFGISKVLHTGGSDTRAGIVFGTPNYMAPEQAQGRSAAVDGRTDVFSLGAIIYECLTGQMAFGAETAIATAYQICHKHPASIRSISPSVPNEVEQVVYHALAKRMQDRPPTARDFRKAFLRACNVMPGSAMPPTGQPRPLSKRLASAPPRTAVAAEVQKLAPPSRSRWAILGVVALLLIVGGMAVVMTSGNSASRTKEGSPATQVRTASPAPTASPARTTTAGSPALTTTPPPPAPMVAIQLVLTPNDARVEVDGVTRTDNPLRLARSDRVYRMVVTAPGYQPLTHEFRALTNGELDLQLKPEEPEEPEESTRSGSRRSRSGRKVRGPLETDL